MARIRSIKPGFFTSPDIAALPYTARLTFAGLWCYCDDDGRGADDARLVKGAVWPLDDPMTLRKVEADLSLLDERGLIQRYESSGRRYLRIVEWGHQVINRPTRSKLPEPPPITDRSVSPPGAVTDGSRQEGNREGNREGEGPSAVLAVTTHDLLRAGAPPLMLSELDDLVAVFVYDHGSEKVDAAVASLLTERLRFPFPSKVRERLEAMLGPSSRSPGEDAQAAAAKLREDGMRQVDALREVAMDPDAAGRMRGLRAGLHSTKEAM